MNNITNELDSNLETGIIALKFSAKWCGPCKKMQPTIEILEKEFSDLIKFCTIDIDDSTELAQKFKIRAVPTFLVIKNGEEVNRIVGLSLIDPLRKILRDVIET